MAMAHWQSRALLALRLLKLRRLQIMMKPQKVSQKGNSNWLRGGLRVMGVLILRL